MCHLPLLYDSLRHFVMSDIFGKTLLKYVYKTFHQELVENLNSMPPEIVKLGTMPFYFV